MLIKWVCDGSVGMEWLGDFVMAWGIILEGMWWLNWGMWWLNGGIWLLNGGIWWLNGGIWWLNVGDVVAQWGMWWLSE
jgi:hypothetical protein